MFQNVQTEFEKWDVLIISRTDGHHIEHFILNR
jgi:hypothetical protein